MSKLVCNNCGCKFEPKEKEIYSHRIICGDARDKKTIAKLMGSNKASMVFSDPPYNVKVKGIYQGLVRNSTKSLQWQAVRCQKLNL